VYQLYHRGHLVYLGKDDKDLRDRLSDHRRKIGGRLNIALRDMSFTGLYLAADWIAVAPEALLIRRLKAVGGVPRDKGGFGNNDPGKERDTTAFEATHLDVLYPANLDFSLVNLRAGRYLVSELIKALKRELPDVFRYENRYTRHPDYLTHHATIPHDGPAADEALQAVADALLAGWQITALPGYVIMYKKLATLPSARKSYRS
jgi:hypothetical protein